MIPQGGGYPGPDDSVVVKRDDGGIVVLQSGHVDWGLSHASGFSMMSKKGQDAATDRINSRHDLASVIAAGFAWVGSMAGHDESPEVNVGSTADERTQGDNGDGDKGGGGRGRGGGKNGGGKRFGKDKAALVDMAKADKRTGMTADDMKAYKELNDELDDPFPEDKVRGPECHPGRPCAASRNQHGHVGPVNHIPIRSSQ